MRRLLAFLLVGVLTELVTPAWGQAIDCALFPQECEPAPKFRFRLQFDLKRIKPKVKQKQVVIKPKVKAVVRPKPPTLKVISEPRKEIKKKIEIPKVIKRRTLPPPSKVLQASWTGLPQMPVITIEEQDLRDIENQYILGFDAATLVAAGIDLNTISSPDFAVQLGLQPQNLRSLQRRFLLTAIVTLNADELARLRSNGLVARITQDTLIKAAGKTPPLSWGLDRLDSPTLPLDGTFNRKGGDYAARVYVFDSAVDAWPDEFGSRIEDGANFVRTAGEDDSVQPKCREHGTEMASLIAGKTTGAAASARIVSLAVLPCRRNSAGTASNVIEAAEWLLEREVNMTDKKPVIANMSLAGKWNLEINRAVKVLSEHGVVVVAAAGNNKSNACRFSPASAPEAITVAATGPNDEIPAFSNFGPCIDVQAPGHLLTAITEDGVNRYVAVSGTSGAAALVSGILARSLTDAGPKAAAAWLSDGAVPALFLRRDTGGLAMVQSAQGWGRLCRTSASASDVMLRAGKSKTAADAGTLQPDRLVMVSAVTQGWLNIITEGGGQGWFQRTPATRGHLRDPETGAACRLTP